MWGYKDHCDSVCNKIQNRTSRIFLGVIDSFGPNGVIQGDMGWKSPVTQRRLGMVKYWNRLCMDDTRLTRHAFNWQCSYHRDMRNWSADMMKELLDLQT